MSDDEQKSPPPSSSKAPPPSSKAAPPPSKAPTTTLQGRDKSVPPPHASPNLVTGTPRVPMSYMPSRPAASTLVGSPRVPMSVVGTVRPPPSKTPTTTLQRRDTASAAPTTMLQGRDSARSPPSKAPTTTLQGRDAAPAPPVTMLLGRDAPAEAVESKEESAESESESSDEEDDLPPAPPVSMFKGRNDDLPPLPKSIMLSAAPPSVSKSVLITPADKAFAAKQMDIESMGDEERAWQEDWAWKQLQKTTNCPEKYDWIRVPGGYQCEGGGHGISDFLLAEGKGGILASKKGTWETMDGPYYPNPNGDKNFIRGVLKK